MRLHAGFVESAAHHELPPLNPANFESDWTASLVAPPTGWAEVTIDGQTYAYTASGSYGADANDTQADIWTHSLSRNASAMALIIAYNIVTWDNIGTSLQVDDGGDGISALFNYNTTDNDGAFVMALDQSGWPGSLVTVNNTNPDGLVILAGTFFQNGDRAFYRFDDNGATTVGTNSGTIPVNHNLLGASIVMQNYDFSNLVAGTAGSIRVRNTYIGFDEELDLTAITAIATSWGWV